MLVEQPRHLRSRHDREAFMSSIPINENHRFLNWMDKRDECMSWMRWFQRRSIPCILVQRHYGGPWTIYKHLWLHKVGSGLPIRCCKTGKINSGGN